MTFWVGMQLLGTFASMGTSGAAVSYLATLELPSWESSPGGSGRGATGPDCSESDGNDGRHMTKEGCDALVAEIDRLWHEERPEVVGR